MADFSGSIPARARANADFVGNLARHLHRLAVRLSGEHESWFMSQKTPTLTVLDPGLLSRSPGNSAQHYQKGLTMSSSGTSPVSQADLSRSLKEEPVRHVVVEVHTAIADAYPNEIVDFPNDEPDVSQVDTIVGGSAP